MKAKKYKEIKMVKISETINVSADSLWNIAKEFDNVAIWSSNIKHAVGSGNPEFEGATCSERTCEVQGLGGYSKVVEKLTMFDEDKRELAYQMTEGAPSFVLFAQNHWSVEEVSLNQSRIKMEVTMRLKRFMGFLLGGQLKKTVDKALPLAMKELKIYAETGEVAATKKKSLQLVE